MEKNLDSKQKYQTTQNRPCLIYQKHEVELIFYYLFIDSLTPLIIFFTLS